MTSGTAPCRTVSSRQGRPRPSRSVPWAHSPKGGHREFVRHPACPHRTAQVVAVDDLTVPWAPPSKVTAEPPRAGGFRLRSGRGGVGQPGVPLSGGLHLLLKRSGGREVDREVVGARRTGDGV